MAFLEGYLEDTDHNNVLIQRVLRDIDDRNFLTCKVRIDEPSQAAIFRNMSQRAAEEVRKGLKEKENFFHESAIKHGQSLFRRRLAMNERYQQTLDGIAGHWQAEATDSRVLRDNLVHVARLAGDDDYDSLEKIRAGSGNRLLKEGLRHIIDSSAPLVARARLEHLRETLTENYARQMKMIVEAIDSILNHDRPGQTVEKLADYLAAD